ncbi:hypothetical protein POTOM_054509 [Populus tomentosa]|uniref:Disease resistance RPP13-like protein 1 n=1 Tax=Populus tomentosa TaxID=118781 RepID=A0A8X8BYK8_POPTO|nr:hypothetical protein POTOM_054509 [Populus tomentosa]
MALALIGGSILSPVIQVLVDRLASRQVLGFFKSHKLDDGLLEKLKETLNTVNGLLDDAEEKQITKLAVKNWLNDVKHAVYEAEDILDEIDYEYLRSKDIDRHDSNWARNLVPFLNPANRRMKEMGAKLQKILAKLERLLKHKGDLRHIEGTGGWRPLSEKTTPLVNESHVYGRDADKEAIMKHLLTQHNTDGSNLCAVPIVGMGGIDQPSTCRTKEPDESLMEAVKGKKLLLVLDDAWNIKYNEWDKLLLPLRYVEQGSKIVVTTRDEDVARVTQTVIPSHRLDVISDEDCWKLFARDAFSGVNSGATWPYESKGDEDTSVEWKAARVKKFHTAVYLINRGPSVPLEFRLPEEVWRGKEVQLSHLKVFGCVSYVHIDSDARNKLDAKSKKCFFIGYGDEEFGFRSSGETEMADSDTSPQRSEFIRLEGLPDVTKQNNNQESLQEDSSTSVPTSTQEDAEQIEPAVRSSGNNPTPKGYVFEKDGLITEWMAQGFLVQPGGVEEMEEIGEKYFDDLVSRSLFQQSTRYSVFSMHDLISDLAEYVSGEFCFKLGINEHSSTLPERTRYLLITPVALYGGRHRMFHSIHGVQHLRALFPRYFSGEGDREALNDIWPNLKRLRMLYLISNLNHSHISSQLLNSIGNLKHLRHLDLSCTAIKRLPKSVCNLYYLQSLLLKECVHLMKLPSNLSNLVDLQYLDIEGTNLKEMPPKMGKLTKLRTLQYYVVGKESGSSMKELGKLSHLRKKLSIRNLRDVANAQDALDANLKGKKKIEELGLMWDGNTDDTQHERDVLEKLEPSENVKGLAILGYGGTTFPRWLGKSSFSNMVQLTLSGCKNCFSLPPLGQLPSLEVLQIKGLDEVVAVGPEFYGSDSSMEKPFKSLKNLQFEGMRNWQEWKTDVAGAFPHLAYLLIVGCPELTNGLPSHLPSLLILAIQGCPQLVVSIPEAPMLTKIKVFDEDRIIEISEPSSHRRCLHFRRDPQLKGMEQMSHLDPSSFTDIKIEECS